MQNLNDRYTELDLDTTLLQLVLDGHLTQEACGLIMKKVCDEITETSMAAYKRSSLQTLETLAGIWEVSENQKNLARIMYKTALGGY